MGKGVSIPVAEEFGFLEMQAMQARLQEKYQDIWEPISPQTGKNKLLWLMIELGEAADIIKKDGAERIMEDKAVRAHFVEELADIMMYYNDVMLCFGISADELKAAYREKHQKNMHRW